MFQFRAFADHMTNPGEVEPTSLMMNNGENHDYRWPSIALDIFTWQY